MTAAATETKPSVTPKDWGDIANALYTAAEVYEDSAHDVSCTPGGERVEAALKAQAVNARRLAEIADDNACWPS